MTATAASAAATAEAASAAAPHNASWCLTRNDAPLLALPGAARDLVAEHLPLWGLTPLVDDAKLVASELVTNAVQHARSGPIGFALKHGRGALRIEVEDACTERPAWRRPSAGDEHGRGLCLVHSLSRTWGYDTHPGGSKTTWCALDATGGERP